MPSVGYGHELKMERAVRSSLPPHPIPTLAPSSVLRLVHEPGRFLSVDLAVSGIYVCMELLDRKRADSATRLMSGCPPTSAATPCRRTGWSSTAGIRLGPRSPLMTLFLSLSQGTAAELSSARVAALGSKAVAFPPCLRRMCPRPPSLRWTKWNVAQSHKRRRQP